MAGGPFVDPTDGAVFIWKDVPVAEVEEFVKTDPYVINGLVPSWSVHPDLLHSACTHGHCFPIPSTAAARLPFLSGICSCRPSRC